MNFYTTRFFIHKGPRLRARAGFPQFLSFVSECEVIKMLCCAMLCSANAFASQANQLAGWANLMDTLLYALATFFILFQNWDPELNCVWSLCIVSMCIVSSDLRMCVCV